MKILHISDLHINSSNMTTVINLFTKIAYNNIDEYVIVITGDMTDNNNKNDIDRVLQALNILKNAKAVLIIPGNHDYFRFNGNGFVKCDDCVDSFNKKFIYPQHPKGTFPLANITDSTLFVGVNSSHPSFFARGKIGKSQLNAIDDVLGMDTKFKVVYLHHHPLRLKHKWWEIWKWFDEKVMELYDSKEFINIINNNKVDVVLFGHRHLFLGRTIKDGVHYINGGKSSKGKGGVSKITIDSNGVSYIKRWKI